MNHPLLHNLSNFIFVMPVLFSVTRWNFVVEKVRGLRHRGHAGWVTEGERERVQLSRYFGGMSARHHCIYARIYSLWPTIILVTTQHITFKRLGGASNCHLYFANWNAGVKWSVTWFRVHVDTREIVTFCRHLPASATPLPSVCDFHPSTSGCARTGVLSPYWLSFWYLHQTYH